MGFTGVGANIRSALVGDEGRQSGTVAASEKVAVAGPSAETDE
jgi:hypothetical protein